MGLVSLNPFEGLEQGSDMVGLCLEGALWLHADTWPWWLGVEAGTLVKATSVGQNRDGGGW